MARTSYRVRNAKGEELTVPSLPDLVALYRGGFLSDEDFVSKTNSTTWVRAGSFEAFHGVREKRRAPRRVKLLLIAAMALATVLGALLAR